MGIENMPINCIDCPEVLHAKVNAEGAHRLAMNSTFDAQEDIPAEIVLDLLLSKHSLEQTAESCELTYESVAQTYELLSRMYGCPGKDPRTHACRLSSTVNQNK